MNFHFISGNLKLSDQNILDQVEKNRVGLDELFRQSFNVNINLKC